jgi:low affinity Fe/Cu permease
MPTSPDPQHSDLSKRIVRFSSFSRYTAKASGHPWSFFIACGVILALVATGPLFHYSDTWQLVINTGTTIVTFLMVFLIQNTQNRDTAAMQIKLDELIRAAGGAHNILLDLEELEERDIEQIRSNYRHLAAEARELVRCGKMDTDSPDIDVGSQRRPA